MKDNRKTIQVLTILTIIFTVMGGSLAYWNWNTTEAQKTVVKFGGGGIDPTPWCSADGGGNITQSGVQIVPTTCTDSEYVSANPGATPRVIKRKITVTANTNKAGSNINLSLWLKVNNLGSGLSQSNNFRYVLTTSSTSCEEGEIISEGTFNGITDGEQVNIISNKIYTSPTPKEYWLYIWLDWPETSTSTMNQPFNFSLGGECTNNTSMPEAPRLDDGMIPVTIDENGDVFTVSSDDASWYNYENKEWANAVLVSNPNRQTYLNNLSNNVQVDEDDILAYYVWIPRYKYRIPYTKCSEIPEDERDMEKYPECYAPYTVTEQEKHILMEYWADFYGCSSLESDLENATNSINTAIETGRLPQGNAIISFINNYNNAASSDSFCSMSSTITDISAIASEFNGNNSFPEETSIDIEFESINDTISRGDAVNTYYTHPAFTWDGNNVAGIWVGKFETTPDKNDACYTNSTGINCNDITQNPTILPNEAPLVYQTIGKQFATSQNLTKSNNVYGLSNTTTDGHMMKNSEWGAVAYLSHSIYGVNKEITINNYYLHNDVTNTYYKTGCGALENVIDVSKTCTNAYGTDGQISYPQSATGNISGIFDMSGGTWEAVMGLYGPFLQIATDFDKLPNSKYYDLYSESEFPTFETINDSLCTLETCGGHAINETFLWYSEHNVYEFPFAEHEFVARGGSAYSGNYAYGLFSYFGYAGIFETADYSWRSVLVVME